MVIRTRIRTLHVGRRAPLLLLAAAALPALSAGCTSKPVGELMLAVQTDLSLPKDIDAIQIQVFNQGVPKYDNLFERFGPGDGSILLPGTIAIKAPENPSDAITITVSARSGGKNGALRMVRQVVTTIPAERTATMQVPLQFLCDGSGKVVQNQPESACPEGKTCLAGTCKDRKVDSKDLPDYADDEVFAGGECFDVASCFDAAIPAVVDLAACTIDDASGDNLALQTEADGMCNAVGCFVALDANSPLGWTKLKNGKIQLPPAVCAKLESGVILDVVTAPSGACGEKSVGLPTCGPWSTGKAGSTYAGPVALAGGQSHPTSIALSGGNVFWSNTGSGSSDGTIKYQLPHGGTPVPVTDQEAPRDVAGSDQGSEPFVVWASALPNQVKTGTISRFAQTASGPVKTQLVSGLDQPVAVAISDQFLFWAEFQTGKIVRAKSDGTGAVDVATGNYPYRMVTDKRYVYWTNEGSAAAAMPDGSIARWDHQATPPEAAVTLDTGLTTPRALALDLDATGNAKAVYYATFVTDGELRRLDLGLPTGPDNPKVLASHLPYPNGIAVDSGTIYWTNRGDQKVPGSLMALPKAGGDPVVLAANQSGAGAVALDATTVYWIIAGSSNAANGAVMKIAKKP